MNELLKYPIIEINSVKLTLLSLIYLVLFWIFIFIVLYLIKRLIQRQEKIEPSKKYSIITLLRYFVYFIGIILSLQLIGFDTTLLIAGSTALLVGLGLGIQNLFSDYISGIIILFDSSIKVGDVLDIDGLICRVIEINLRTTKVETRDDKYILLPNTDLTRKHIINWTHQKIDSRFEVKVGVDYSSNTTEVINAMKAATSMVKGVNKTPEPFVRFDEFADSSKQFSVHFWSADVFRVENIKSDIRIKIFDEFEKQGINIPYPQRVIHINNAK